MKTDRKPSFTCLDAGISLGLVGPEDGGDMFIRNVG
jgi:hypothetical protein